jgi:hypothetical protein
MYRNGNGQNWHLSAQPCGSAAPSSAERNYSRTSLGATTCSTPVKQLHLHHRHGASSRETTGEQNDDEGAVGKEGLAWARGCALSQHTRASRGTPVLLMLVRQTCGFFFFSSTKPHSKLAKSSCDWLSDRMSGGGTAVAVLFGLLLFACACYALFRWYQQTQKSEQGGYDSFAGSQQGYLPPVQAGVQLRRAPPRNSVESRKNQPMMMTQVCFVSF